MCVVTSPSETTSAARTSGVAALAFRRGADGGTRLARLHQQAPLRALFPLDGDAGLGSAVLLTTTGGLVGGDRLDVQIEAGEGTAVRVTTQAAEKVYRSLGGDCRIAIELRAASESWLEWLPQETILFEGARLDRITRIEYAPGARVLAGEMLVFGRSAHGETLTRGRFRDCWEVRQQGRLVFVDALAAAGELAPVLASSACFAGAAAVATALCLGDAMDDALAYAHDLAAGAAAGDMAVAATCVAGMLVCRWLGPDARALRAAFGRFWAALRHRLGGWTEVLPRVWCV
jgi:urease accessory protein